MCVCVRPSMHCVGVCVDCIHPFPAHKVECIEFCDPKDNEDMFKCVVYSHETLDKAEGAEQKAVDNPYQEHRQKLLQTQVDHSYKDAMEYDDIDHVYDYISVKEWFHTKKSAPVRKEVWQSKSGLLALSTHLHPSHPSLLSSSPYTGLTPHHSPHPSLLPLYPLSCCMQKSPTPPSPLLKKKIVALGTSAVGAVKDVIAETKKRSARGV